MSLSRAEASKRIPRGTQPPRGGRMRKDTAISCNASGFTAINHCIAVFRGPLQMIGNLATENHIVRHVYFHERTILSFGMNRHHVVERWSDDFRVPSLFVNLEGMVDGSAAD